MDSGPGQVRMVPMFLLTALLGLAALDARAEGADTGRLEKGKQLATTRSKGNCLACHEMDGGKLAGNLGPPLLAMKLRFPDKAELRAQVWDATERNPDSRMPPFGKHGILSEEEIDLIVDYIYSL